MNKNRYMKRTERLGDIAEPMPYDSDCLVKLMLPRCTEDTVGDDELFFPEHTLELFDLQYVKENRKEEPIAGYMTFRGRW